MQSIAITLRWRKWSLTVLVFFYCKGAGAAASHPVSRISIAHRVPGMEQARRGTVDRTLWTVAGRRWKESYPKLTDRISYVRSPPGAGTEMVSPTFLLISALARGEEMLRRDCLMSASCMPTIW